MPGIFFFERQELFTVGDDKSAFADAGNIFMRKVHFVEDAIAQIECHFRAGIECTTDACLNSGHELSARCLGI